MFTYATRWCAIAMVGLVGGCAYQTDLQDANEALDLAEQLADTRVQNYQPLDADFVENNKNLAARTSDEFATQVSTWQEDGDDYRAGVANKHSTRKVETLSLRPNYGSGRSLVALDGASEQRLRQHLARFKAKPGLKIRVVGHASAVPLGPQAKQQFGNNKALSKARARAAAESIAGHMNMPVADISISGAGSSQPVSSNRRAKSNRRIEVSVTYPGQSRSSYAARAIPAGFAPWWRTPALSRMLDGSERVEVDLESLFLRALHNSNQIKVFKDIPLIRETGVVEAEGEFDPHLFAEAMYKRANEPVGSTLKTGGPSRFKEHDSRLRVGVRKKTYTGADVELSQRIGTLDNNSVFLTPDEQGLTRFNISFTQPLLNQAGIEYNRSTVQIAKLDHAIAEYELRRQVESHLLEIARAYWTLYLERAELLIKKRNVARSAKLLGELRARTGFDVLPQQLAKAKARHSARRAELVRASLAIRNAEAKIQSLVNDPQLMFKNGLELQTTLAPTDGIREVSLKEAARTALLNRPEIQQATRQLRAGLVRLKMSENELLPVLDFVAGVTWDGLERDYGIGEALGTQFSEDGPSWNVGLLLDVPLSNRVARARHERRRLEVRQLTNQLRTTIDTLLLEVRVAVREVAASRREMAVAYEAMSAAAAQLRSLQAREVLSAPGTLGTTLVDSALEAQESLTETELELARSTVTHSLALNNLNRAMGLLLDLRQIKPVTQRADNKLPEIIFQ